MDMEKIKDNYVTYTKNRKTEEEQYKSEQEALQKLIDRRKLEEDRYVSAYGLKMNDISRCLIRIENNLPRHFL